MSEDFLLCGSVAKKLKVGSQQLYYMSPEFLRLRIKLTGTQRFPVRYIAVYTAFLRSRGLAATRGSAKEFSDTEEALRLSDEIQTNFAASLASRPTFTSMQAAAILCVTHETMRSWGGQYSLSDRVDNPNYGKDATGPLVHIFSRERLKEIVEWMIPKRVR